MTKHQWKAMALSLMAVLFCLISIVVVTVPEKVLAQVTSADQFSDINTIIDSSDVDVPRWTFQAFQSLVERYGVIQGYPDGTFRFKDPLTRGELAKWLNNVTNRIDELTATSFADAATQEDFQSLQELYQEIAAELAAMQ